MAFGVRRSKVGIDETFYACPLCNATYVERADLVDHLVKIHGMNKKEANALTKVTA